MYGLLIQIGHDRKSNSSQINTQIFGYVGNHLADEVITGYFYHYRKRDEITNNKPGNCLLSFSYYYIKNRAIKVFIY